MKLSIAAAAIAGLLCCYLPASTSASARETYTRTGPDESVQATDPSARRRSRHAYHQRFARPFYEPYYYGRPTEYRPYGLVPFFFGLSFPYRTW